jgi:two-component system, LytTR family, response regulator
MPKLSAVIVDDDPAAHDQLRELCNRHRELRIIAECRSPVEARQLIIERRPDLAFLDVQMRPISGIELALSLPAGSTPMLVFVTAYDQYAVNAFDANAVDYLLKPVEARRFAETVRRVVARGLGSQAASHHTRLITGLANAGEELADRIARENAPHRLILEIGRRVHLIEHSSIESAEADGNDITISTNDGATYCVRAPLGELLAMLPRDRFLQVSRSVIVNTRRIAQMERLTHGEYQIRLASGRVVATSRLFRQRIQGTILRKRSGGEGGDCGIVQSVTSRPSK